MAGPAECAADSLHQHNDSMDEHKAHRGVPAAPLPHRLAQFPADGLSPVRFHLADKSARDVGRLDHLLAVPRAGLKAE